MNAAPFLQCLSLLCVGHTRCGTVSRPCHSLRPKVSWTSRNGRQDRGDLRSTPVTVRSVFARAASTLDDSQDRLYLFPDDGAELATGLMHLGTVLLADGRDLFLLIVGQVQVLEVRDPVGHSVTDPLPALVLELLELLLLPL